MVYRTEIKIKPADLTDLTVTTDLSSWNLEQFTIEDNALIGDISATDNTANITISSTGYITQTIAFSDIPPTIYLIPANEVETLSDGTNSYPIADKMARLMLDDKADIIDIPTKTSDLTNDSNFATVSQIPTNNNQLTNGAGYITSADLPTNYVTTDTAQDITGKKVFSRGSNQIMLSQPGITKGTNPATTQYINFGLMGADTSAYTDRIGCLETSVDTSGNVTTYLRAYKNTASASTESHISIVYPATGDAYTEAPTPATSDNSTKIATTAYVKSQNYLTTTTKTVADSGCTFGLGNGLKIITTEIQISANTDYSWSYGTTFTNVPKIFIARRTGASTDTGVYTPWVRGTVGKSSCTIFNVNSGTVMLMAIGN